MAAPPREEYHEVTRSSQLQRRGARRRSVIEAAKAKVRTIDLADLLCGPGKLRKVGKRWVARCPLPNHEDRTPIQAGGDEDERRTEIEYLWDAAGEIAILIVAGGSG